MQDWGNEIKQGGTFLLAQNIYRNTFQNIIIDRMGQPHIYNTGRNNLNAEIKDR